MYWPCAIALEDSKPIELHTNESCETLEDVQRVFRNWQGAGYVILATWMQSDRVRCVNFRPYVDSVGVIKKVE